jgi:hypothetical protein
MSTQTAQFFTVNCHPHNRAYAARFASRTAVPAAIALNSQPEFSSLLSSVRISSLAPAFQHAQHSGNKQIITTVVFHRLDIQGISEQSLRKQHGIVISNTNIEAPFILKLH